MKYLLAYPLALPFVLITRLSSICLEAVYTMSRARTILLFEYQHYFVAKGRKLAIEAVNKNNDLLDLSFNTPEPITSKSIVSHRVDKLILAYSANFQFIGAECPLFGDFR